MPTFKWVSILMLSLMGCSSTDRMHAVSSVSVSRNVLVILSSKDYVTTREGVRHPTGFFLSELAEPAIALTQAGYRLTFATPGGVRPTMDVISNDVKWFKSVAQFEDAKSFVRSTTNLEHPVVLERLTSRDLASYAGVVVPGGHAPMEDLSQSEDVARVLLDFHEHKKPTALICHGPAALLPVKNHGVWAYRGYKMTGFTKAEEQQEENAGHLDGHMKFYLDEELQSAGGHLAVGAPWSSTVVRDRELITGQNPMSGGAFVHLLLEALGESH